MRIEDLTNINPWWKFGKEFWKYDKNLKEAKKFIEFQRSRIELKKGNIYIIRGLRQTGKTTYLKQRILELINKGIKANSILYISCDKLASRKELHNTINNFIQTNMEAKQLYIFLDEITYIEDWNIELKILADSNFIDKIIVVATGSNPIKIKAKGERLPGRRVEGNEYYFKPITFREFVLQVIDKLLPSIESKEFSDSLKILKEKIKNISINLKENLGAINKKTNIISAFKEELDYLLNIYLSTGGFPSTINNYLENKFRNGKEEIKNELYETLIRMILGDISKIKRSENLAREIIRSILEKYGSKYSFTNLGKDSGMPHQTVIEYLEILENSFLLEVFHSLDIGRKKPKFKGDKKIYFSDPFLYHSISSYLAGSDGFPLSKENLLKNKDKIIEAVIANHLSQTQEVPYLREWKTYLWFFYTSTGKEIDFIYKKEKEYLGIEAKYKESIEEKEITKIEEIKEYIALTKNQFEKSDNILFIPLSLFLSLLEKSARVL